MPTNASVVKQERPDTPTLSTAAHTYPSEEHLRASHDEVQAILHDFDDRARKGEFRIPSVEIAPAEVPIWNTLFGVALIMACQLEKQQVFFHAVVQKAQWTKDLIGNIQVVFQQRALLAKEPNHYHISVAKLKQMLAFLQNAIGTLLDIVSTTPPPPSSSSLPSSSFSTYPSSSSSTSTTTPPPSSSIPVGLMRLLEQGLVRIPPLHNNAFEQSYLTAINSKNPNTLENMRRMPIGGRSLSLWDLHREILQAGTLSHVEGKNLWYGIGVKLGLDGCVPNGTNTMDDSMNVAAAQSVAALKQVYTKCLEEFDKRYIAVIISGQYQIPASTPAKPPPLNMAASTPPPQAQAELSSLNAGLAALNLPSPQTEPSPQNGQQDPDFEIQAAERYVAVLKIELIKRLPTIPSCVIPRESVPWWNELFQIAKAAAPDVEKQLPVHFVIFRDRSLLWRLYSYVIIIFHQEEILERGGNTPLYFLSVTVLQAVISLFHESMVNLRRAIAELREKESN